VTWPDARARGFGEIAALYDRVRPGYPVEAIDWMLSAEVRDVLDCGVGTGKLSDAIVPTGRAVTAADPDAGMLAVLRAKHPEVPTVVARAEELPLPDASFDAVVFGQSWHWVDPPRASAEVARVLRPGGMLGLFWNIRDARKPWVAELAAITGHRSADEIMMAAGGPTVTAPLRADATEVFDWEAHLDVATLVDLIATHGFALEDAEPERARMLDEVRALGERVADADGRIALPYRLFAYRYRAA
jgi:ubiquinone/menaquinone biosynthesis C-methylase UbiE